jgi:hypothetical protein
MTAHAYTSKKAKLDIEANWLRGFADGEGYVTKSRTQTGQPSARCITISNTDEALVKYACRCLDNLGITYRVVVRKMVNKKPISIIIISHQQNLIKWKELVGFTTPRKQERLELLISEYTHPNKCWDKEFVNKIIDDRNNGMSYSMLAKKYDYSIGGVFRLVKNTLAGKGRYA